MVISCNDFHTTSLPVKQDGNFDFKDTVTLNDTIKFGTKLYDSIAIVYYNQCYTNPYFEINNINEFTIEYRLYNKLTSESCTGNSIIKSKVYFEFKPPKKGNYTLQIRDRLFTFYKKLTVE